MQKHIGYVTRQDAVRVARATGCMPICHTRGFVTFALPKVKRITYENHLES
jgi:hypothetical protein